VDCASPSIEYAEQSLARFDATNFLHWMIIMTSLSMATSRLINGSSTAC